MKNGMPEVIEKNNAKAICPYNELRSKYDELQMKYSAVCKERDELKSILKGLEK